MTQTNFTVTVLFREYALDKLSDSDRKLLLDEEENCTECLGPNLYDFGSFSDYYDKWNVVDMLESFGLVNDVDFEIL